MILLKKTMEDIMQETLIELKEIGIKDEDAGGVARLLLSLINKRIAGFYDVLDINIAQAFVSQAKDQFLDHIGVLLDCERRYNEDDDNYRYRISKQTQIIANANKIAIRLAALSVEGVTEVKLKRWTHGAGSYSVYVISDNPVTEDEILAKVLKKINETEAFGIRGEVFRPNIIPAEMKIRLVFDKGVSDIDRDLTISKALDVSKKYINGLNVEEIIDINELKKRINELHEQINEIIIFHFKINNRVVLPVNQECAWNERFIESDKPNAIQVM